MCLTLSCLKIEIYPKRRGETSGAMEQWEAARRGCAKFAEKM